MPDRVSSHVAEVPRRRAQINGLHVAFESRDPKLASIRWHYRFKQRYRTKAQAEAAKRMWEDKGRILFPGDFEAAKPTKALPKRPVHDVAGQQLEIRV
jgi:hypothetical protein